MSRKDIYDAIKLIWIQFGDEKKCADEAGIPLSNEDLGEQLLLLLFAGYETTASALSCLMRELLLNPSVEAWLRDEVDWLCWPPAPAQAKICREMGRQRPATYRGAVVRAP